jgi:murein DD-endopeptidase MepM/ murein hydrolase activator NlpD
MNVILVPKSHGKGRNISFSHYHVVVLAVVVLLFLPAVMGVVTYKIHELLSTQSAMRNPEYLQQQERMLAEQRQEIETTRRNAEIHLNALAQRLGYMQAQMLRINALGQRLTRMAGLDKREFDFTEEPAMGGPESSAALSSPPVEDFIKSLDDLSANIEKRTQSLAVMEGLMMDRQLQAAVYPGGWPTEGGWMSSGFGLRTDPFSGHKAYHEGVDIASRLGSSIKAMGGGVVSYAGPKDGYGLLVEINHGNGVATRYGHASAVLVKVGDRIQKGQDVALVGSSGRSTGPHLHFEVLQGGRAVNPQSYLQAAQ